jgi:hypothetical protein
MDNKTIFAIITGLSIGACVAWAGIYMYMQSTTALTDQAPLRGPLVTSMPIPHPLGNGTTVDLSIFIINGSGDETIGSDTEQDLEDAGFSIEDSIHVAPLPHGSTLQFKPDKRSEAELLEEWADGDWGTLTLHDDLEATQSYDAVLTIGNLDHL